MLAFLIYSSLCAEFCEDVLNLPDAYGLQAFFSLSHEGNLPTWFISCLLCACALLLALIATAKQQQQAPLPAPLVGPDDRVLVYLARRVRATPRRDERLV